LVANLIYNGFWYSAEMEFLMAAINKSQEKVSGKVFLSLYKGNVIVTGRESANSLYNATLSSMNEEGGYNQKDASGFIKIVGLKFKTQRV